MAPDTLARINQQIETAIPLARAAGIRVAAGPRQMLTAHAPFAANGNPHGSVFGGSLYTAALVAGYAQTVYLLDAAGLEAAVVIGSARADYRRPLHGDIAACVEPIEAAARERLITATRRHGRGRIDLTITVANARMAEFVLKARFAARKGGRAAVE